MTTRFPSISARAISNEYVVEFHCVTSTWHAVTVAARRKHLKASVGQTGTNDHCYTTLRKGAFIKNRVAVEVHCECVVTGRSFIRCDFQSEACPSVCTRLGFPQMPGCCFKVISDVTEEIVSVFGCKLRNKFSVKMGSEVKKAILVDIRELLRVEGTVPIRHERGRKIC